MLSQLELESYRNQGNGKRAGKYFRYYCPLHGSDKQRSLTLDPETGWYRCFSCGEKGQLAERRNQWNEERRASAPVLPWQAAKATLKVSRTFPVMTNEPPKFDPMLKEFSQHFAENLQKTSLGARYLEHRGISFEIAKKLGVGMIPPEQCRDRFPQTKFGRISFPHHNPAGEIINIYSRGIGDKDQKSMKHHHLPGTKGVFNCSALARPTVFLCEGVFDALTLLQLEIPAVAIFGLNVNWEWVEARHIMLALDEDPSGNRASFEFYVRAKILGFNVRLLDRVIYQDCKDLNSSYVKDPQRFTTIVRAAVGELSGNG